MWSSKLKLMLHYRNTGSLIPTIARILISFNFWVNHCATMRATRVWFPVKVIPKDWQWGLLPSAVWQTAKYLLSRVSIGRTHINQVDETSVQVYVVSFSYYYRNDWLEYNCFIAIQSVLRININSQIEKLLVFQSRFKSQLFGLHVFFAFFRK